MPECKHPCCGEKCRKKKEPKPRTTIRRTPLPRSTVTEPGSPKKGKRIRAVAKKRKSELEEYARLRESFLGKHDECQIKAPAICSYSALVIHHTNGRENGRLLIVEDWMASCPGCNVWIETSAGTKWAYENGIKKHKHREGNIIRKSF